MPYESTFTTWNVKTTGGKDNRHIYNFLFHAFLIFFHDCIHAEKAFVMARASLRGSTYWTTSRLGSSKLLACMHVIMKNLQ